MLEIGLGLEIAVSISSEKSKDVANYIFFNTNFCVLIGGFNTKEVWSVAFPTI